MNPSLSPGLVRGSTPLLISVPHAGIAIPESIRQRLNRDALAVPDTDWFVDRLYAWAKDMGAGMLVAGMSRYVVDLNRPPDDRPLYSATETKLLTGLVPRTTFDGDSLYPEGMEPTDGEVERRVRDFWRPYHQELQNELGRLVEFHGHAVLFDAHSIRSKVPLLFDEELPVFNLGSNSGASASASLITQAHQVLSQSGYSAVLDGRFKGGYITRQYGNPAKGVHALQLELAQSAYMDEQAFAWDETRAVALQEVLRKLVDTLIDWIPEAA